MGVVQAVVGASLTVQESISTSSPFISAATNQVTHNKLNFQVTLNPTTTNAVSQVAGFQKAMTAGAATIDLTALAGTNGITVDGTTLKPKAIILRNPSTNTGLITISRGASNGHNLLGASGFSIPLYPKQEILINLDTVSQTIDSTHKTWDIAGTGTEALDVLLILG